MEFCINVIFLSVSSSFPPFFSLFLFLFKVYIYMYSNYVNSAKLRKPNVIFLVLGSKPNLFPNLAHCTWAKFSERNVIFLNSKFENKSRLQNIDLMVPNLVNKM